MRRVISLWLPRFATDRQQRGLRRARPARTTDKTPCPDNITTGASRADPLALVAQERGRLVLAAVDAVAQAGGLSPGQPLADARALLPGLRTLPHDPQGDGAALERLADWCGRYSPWTAPCSSREGSGFAFGGAGGLLLDITGCAHLFAPASPGGAADAATQGAREAAGEAALMTDLLARLAGFGFSARAGLADSSGAAWALARFATTPTQPWLRAAPGQTWQALAPLPPAALRLPEATVELMARFGFTRLSDLARLPRASLAPRFGVLVARRLDQLQGRENEPISPRRPVPEQLARQLFAEPIATTGIDAAVTQALTALMEALCQRLQDQGLGARRLELTCYRVDGSLQRLALGTSRPSRDSRHLLRLFDNRLESLDPGFGFEAMTLSAAIAEPLGAQQFGLRPGNDPNACSDDVGEEGLAGLVDRLGARLGLQCVRRPLPRASHIPERAQRLLPVADKAAAGKSEKTLLDAVPAWRRGPARPLRLLPRPEPVEAVALLPDHPPARFRWRRLLHEVVRAEGPATPWPAWCVPMWRPGRQGLRFSSARGWCPRTGRSCSAIPSDRAAYGRLCRLLTLGKRRAEKGALPPRPWPT